MVTGLTAAIAASVLFGVAAVVQAVAARRGPLVSGLMVLVVAAYLLGWLLHLVAIAQLPLYLAQVGISGSLVVTALVASWGVGEPLLRRHWAAIAAVVAGLVLLVAAAGSVGAVRFDLPRTLALYVACALLLVVGLITTRLPGGRGGVVLGVLAGLAYSGSPIASRALVDPRWDVDLVLPAVTVGIFGLLGFWLYSRAMQRVSITAATAPLVLLQTVVPAAVGVLAFGDGVRQSWWPVAVAGLAISTAGALVLSAAGSRPERETASQPALADGHGAAEGSAS